MMYDLETWRLLWWALLGLLVIAFALHEGISLGALLMLTFVPDTAAKRNGLLGLVAPVSLANFAWLIILLTALFAAWPVMFAVALTSFQPALLLILLSLLLRPLALYFYAADVTPDWRRYATKAAVISGWLPALLLGLLAGNLLKGIPFHLESDMHIAFLGDFMSLLNLFSLLVAATCAALLLLYGASYVQLKSNGDLHQQARALQLRAGLLFLTLFTLSGLWITHLEGYHISSDILTNAASNPLAKFVKRGEGLWLDNYEHIPALITIPTLVFLSTIASLWLARSGRDYWAMLTAGLAVAMTVLTMGISMFPFLLPSNLSLNSSLTLWDSSASQNTLQTLAFITAIALPLLIILHRWLFSMVSDVIAPAEPDLSEEPPLDPTPE